MVRCVVGSILHGGPIELFLVPASVPCMVKDHSDSERGNLLPPHALLFPIMLHSTYSITHTTAFVTPVVENLLKMRFREIKCIILLISLINNF